MCTSSAKLPRKHTYNSSMAFYYDGLEKVKGKSQLRSCSYNSWHNCCVQHQTNIKTVVLNDKVHKRGRGALLTGRKVGNPSTIAKLPKSLWAANFSLPTPNSKPSTTPMWRVTHWYHLGERFRWLACEFWQFGKLEKKEKPWLVQMHIVSSGHSQERKGNRTGADWP